MLPTMRIAGTRRRMGMVANQSTVRSRMVVIGRVETATGEGDDPRRLIGSDF